MATPIDTSPTTYPAGSQPTRLTFNQFFLGQLTLLLAVVIIFSAIAFVVSQNRPTGGTAAVASGGGGGGGSAPAAGAVSSGPITAFTSEPVAQQIQVAADPSGALKWDKATYEAQAGDVSFVVINKSSTFHNFAVEGSNVTAQSKNFGANTTNTYTIKGLPPGEYLIVCNYPGHRSAGMVAKLIVR